MQDFRKGQLVVATLEVEDQGQDFIEIDILQNGVLLGNSVIFSHGRISLLGIGALDGTEFFTNTEILQVKYPHLLKVSDLFVYFYNTGEKQPLPWEAQTLKYKVKKIKKPIKPRRFLE